MSEEQIQQLVAQVSQMLQEGTDPNEIVNMLVQEGLQEDQAMQIVDAAAGQGGGQPQGGRAPETGASTMSDGTDPNQIISEVLQQVGPNVMLALLEAYDALGTQGQEGMKQQLSQMSDQGEQSQGSAEGTQPQGAEQMFG